LGVTWQLPERDRVSYYKKQMLIEMAILFGGRIAEEVFLDQMSTGASNDFERATKIARDMVMRYGMSDALGPMVYADNEGEVFLGRSVTKQSNMSEETMRKVDAEIRMFIDQQYAVSRKLIEENRDKIEAMTAALMELETIDADQINDIMAGLPPRPMKTYTQTKPKSDETGTGGNAAVSTAPVTETPAATEAAAPTVSPVNTTTSTTAPVTEKPL
jgi:cell division protease FtsH